MKNKTKISDLSGFFENEDADGSWVGERLLKMMEEKNLSEIPPFPKQIQVEITNICNHACEFCAYTMMQRKKGNMPKDLFKSIVTEAFDLGSREIGLFAGAEPLTCKWLDEHIKLCKEIGYEYQYISTNGALGDEGRFRKIIDAGLSSIKFSVNGGNKDVYREVHGKDHFDKVIKNIKYVNRYRDDSKKDLFLGVSFVGMENTKHTFRELKELLDGHVDEIIYYEASNQSGQMPNLPLPPYRDCHLPFNKVHISVEGYMKACCNDYENYLAVSDVKEVSLLEAWHGKLFRDLRKNHLENSFANNLCSNCIRGSQTTPEPLNKKLARALPNWRKINSG